MLLLAVPSALFGAVAFAGPFAGWLRPPGITEHPPNLLPLDEELIHFGPELVYPVALLLLGAGLAWWRWRRDPAADPALALGPLRPAFDRAFWLDELQHTLVVRPVTALARIGRRADEALIDGAVEGTGRGSVALGVRLGTLHRAGLPRAATAVLAGALLIGLTAVLIGVAG